MKKTYTKPVIFFEDFTLNTNIAGDCEAKLNTPSNGVCGYMPEGVTYTIFTNEISGCQRKYADGAYGDGICYHVPMESNNLFNS